MGKRMSFGDPGLNRSSGPFFVRREHFLLRRSAGNAEEALRHQVVISGRKWQLYF